VLNKFYHLISLGNNDEGNTNDDYNNNDNDNQDHDNDDVFTLF
jgi:hypothetical protein